MLLTIIIMASAFIGLYRSWLLHRLKFKQNERKTNVLTYLKSDFGNINHLFVPYISKPANNSLCSLVKLINVLTTLFYFTGVLSILLFIIKIANN